MATLIKAKDYQDMSRMAAMYIAAQIMEKPDCVLGLATGTTPIGTYDQLTQWNKEGLLDFAQVKTANLDEYAGIAGDHVQSYRYFMNEHLFNRINIDIANTHVPNGMAADIQAECSAYDAMIENMGGVDIQLLGIGHDGHIGFNEPDAEFSKGTHITDLTEMTIQANSRLFQSADEVPRQALTMGIGTIMAAKKIILIANGAGKKEIMKKAFFGPVTPQVPASILQFHPNVVVIAEPEAYPE